MNAYGFVGGSEANSFREVNRHGGSWQSGIRQTRGYRWLRFHCANVPGSPSVLHIMAAVQDDELFRDYARCRGKVVVITGSSQFSVFHKIVSDASG